MPRRSRSIATLSALRVRLGDNCFERYRVTSHADGASTRRHVGWQWPCDCVAFARDDGAYLWIGCKRHLMP